MSSKTYYSKPSKPYTKRKPAKPTRQRIGDYQVFVGAFPRGELAERIQQMREEINGGTVEIAPHVMLAGTYWRNGKATRAGAQGLIDLLETIAVKIKPFDLKLGGIRTFGKRVIYLGAAPTEPMLAARHILLDEIGEDKHRRFRPHMALAEHLDQPLFDEALLKWRESEWENGRFTTPITELCLMQRAENEPVWRMIHTAVLK